MYFPQIESIIAAALAEDIGSGDRTSDALLSGAELGSANILAKSPGVLCGVDVARAVFAQVDPSLTFFSRLSDGALVSGDKDVVARVEGSLKSILTAERTALNLMQRMSGVASITKKFVDAVQSTNAKIVDTRKTMPGLRVLDKYAVTVGGAHNHRTGLYDGVLIKDNHIAAVGSVTRAIDLARRNSPHTLKIEVEAKTLAQVREALKAQADIIMLDNMDSMQLRDAVALVNGRALLEASGGVSLATVVNVAATGVDLISVGALTHSAPAMDISLDFITDP